MRAVIVATAVIVSIAPSALLAQADSAATAPVAETYNTTDTAIGTLLDDPQSRAILDKYMPQLSKSSPSMVRSSTLKSLQGYAFQVLTDKVLADIDVELAMLGPKPMPAQDTGKVPTINVNEAKVRPYTLPDLLTLSNGERVGDATTWWKKRRPEIYTLLETQQFGRAPGRPTDQRFEVFDKGTAVFDGRAIRKQVMIYFSPDPAAPHIQLVEYIPAAAKKPVPMLLMLVFSAPSGMFNDPGIRQGTVWNPQTNKRVPAPPSPQAGRFDVLPFLDAGIGVAAYYYGDVDPDFNDGYSSGIRGFYDKGEQVGRAPDAWGSVSAWAWSMSRVEDYFETDPAVDSKRVAINGASRLGKTVLWAAARDQRFAAVTACCSGEGGAALSHRNFGETIASLTDMAPYQFAPNYRQYASNESTLPMDSHMLLALIAPRPVFLQTGKYDHAADPKGEFEAAVAVGAVYKLLGKQGLSTTTWPPSQPILNDVGYYMNNGGHGMVAGDWDVYLAFLKKHL